MKTTKQWNEKFKETRNVGHLPWTGCEGNVHLDIHILGLSERIGKTPSQYDYLYCEDIQPLSSWEGGSERGSIIKYPVDSIVFKFAEKTLLMLLQIPVARGGEVKNINIEKWKLFS